MPGAGDPAADRLGAGGRALLLLADPVSVSIVRQLASGPLESTELLDRVDYVSRSTYFERMRDLEELSIIVRRRRADVPPVAECWLGGPGQRLLPVADLLEAWLSGAPQGPLKLGEAYATVAIKSLAVAWGSTLLRWLAERPCSLAELAQLVDGLGYRKLERNARDLIKVGLAERLPDNRRPTLHRATPWARQAAGSLTAAMRWEQHEIPGKSAPVTSIEAEGALLLALPQIELPVDANGTCALLVDADAPGEKSLGGAVVRLTAGQPVSWGSIADHRSEADCWVRGTTSAWLGAASDRASGGLRRGGDNTLLAANVLTALREAGSAHWSIPVGGSSESAELA
ncbi:MAG TPA: winged helix-turn-helix transcriptional regulator [Solirubrobacterales bacterium]|jgi:DNA-binding HxlR family transcriptional regulator